MHRLPKISYYDIERIIEFRFRARDGSGRAQFVALARARRQGSRRCGACDAMRGMFDLMNICGEVVIGEGIKDDAPGIF